jgi:hypothetical protein
MFEKEAEEYFETECLHSYADTEEQLKEDVVPAFQKGAEFGYNKANEWHYVKDELPDHNGQFYVALKGYKETYILSYDYDEDNDDKMIWIDEDGTNFDEEVYAWCEKLKAPKES